MGELLLLSARKGLLSDLDFLIWVDLKNEGYTVKEEIQMTHNELQQHKNKIASFLEDEDKGVFIFEDELQEVPVAVIMFGVRHLNITYNYEIFNELDRDLFPSDGRFMDIFQLWVDSRYRRKGLAKELKKKVEEEAIKQHIGLVYTHTEETNAIVLKLNEQLGYREVRRGTIWDEVVRVSLIKKL